MNVYLVRLVEQGSAWSLNTLPIYTEAIQVNAPFRADQFCPVIHVDDVGRIHVLYYDNRPSTGNDGFGAQFDAWYALSIDHGASFTTYNLRTNSSASPALDLGLQGTQVPANWSPREYNGLASHTEGDTTRVWMIYTGTCLDSGTQDQDGHRTVLFGQQIVVEEEP